jgi:hypothetical protein
MVLGTSGKHPYAVCPIHVLFHVKPLNLSQDANTSKSALFVDLETIWKYVAAPSKTPGP